MTMRADRRGLLLAAVALPACGALPGAADGPAGPLPMPRVNVGDRWRYRLTDRSSGRWLDEPTWQVVDTVPEIRIEVHSRARAAVVQERWAGAWAALDETLRGQSFAFQAPMPLVPSPLEPGRSLRSTGAYADPGSGRRLGWSQQLSVGGWSTLRVPAGEFRCLRIERMVNYQHPDPQRWQSSFGDTLWYAPEVNRWVRRELSSEYRSNGERAGMVGPGQIGHEETLLWELTDYLPAPIARRSQAATTAG